MPDLVPAAALQNVGKADDVGGDVGHGIDQAVPDAGLGSQVDNVGEALFLEEELHAGLVGQISPNEGESLHAFEDAQAVLLEAHAVVVAEIVYAGDAVALAKQKPGEMEADEAGRACDKCMHGALLGDQGVPVFPYVPWCAKNRPSTGIAQACVH